MEKRNFCAECKGKCCKKTYFSFADFHNLVEKIGMKDAMMGMTVLDDGFISGDPCPALTETGCVLEYNKRPILCRWYPFIPIMTKSREYALLLATKTCPYWREFGELYDEQMEEFTKFCMAEKGI